MAGLHSNVYEGKIHTRPTRGNNKGVRDAPSPHRTVWPLAESPLSSEGNSTGRMPVISVAYCDIRLTTPHVKIVQASPDRALTGGIMVSKRSRGSAQRALGSNPAVPRRTISQGLRLPSLSYSPSRTALLFMRFTIEEPSAHAYAPLTHSPTW